MTTSSAPPDEREKAGALVRVSDAAFIAMDRLDEVAFLAEMQGKVVDDMAYEVRGRDGQPEKILSKTGVDECCIRMAQRGEAIREEDLVYELHGDETDPDAVAYFKVTAARYRLAVGSSSVREAKLDQAIGTKRQPLYHDAAEPLSLDSKLPGRKANGRTIRQLLEQDRGLVEWFAMNARDDALADICGRALLGEDVAVQPQRQFNPFWFEHGSMKAARNARLRLVPSSIKQMILNEATTKGKVRRVDEVPPPSGAPPIERQKAKLVITENTPFPYGTVTKGKTARELTTPQLRWATQRDDAGALVNNFAPVLESAQWAQVFEEELRRRDVAAQDRAEDPGDVDDEELMHDDPANDHE